MDFASFMGKTLKIVQNRWRLACMRAELGLLDDEALKDVGLTRAQVWENPRLANWLRNDPYRHHKAG